VTTVGIAGGVVEAARGAAVVAAWGRNLGRNCRGGQGSHRGLEARSDLWGCPTRHRSGGTCSGESGPNGGNRVARLTKKI
jgi:hypothetical protein